MSFMSKNQPASTVKKRPVSIKKVIGRGLLLGVVLFVVYIFLFGDYGAYRMWKQKREIAQLQRTIESLRLRREELKREISLLENDPEYTEKLAREEYGMVKRGEILYKIVPAPIEETGKDREGEDEPSHEERP